jgi:hypothetical protein
VSDLNKNLLNIEEVVWDLYGLELTDVTGLFEAFKHFVW